MMHSKLITAHLTTEDQCTTLQMKAVNRNLAHNPYGAPTVFMTGGWMNLKRVCHFVMSQAAAAAALKSPQGQLGLAVI